MARVASLSRQPIVSGSQGSHRERYTSSYAAIVFSIFVDRALSVRRETLDLSKVVTL